VPEKRPQRAAVHWGRSNPGTRRRTGDLRRSGASHRTGKSQARASTIRQIRDCSLWIRDTIRSRRYRVASYPHLPNWPFRRSHEAGLFGAPSYLCRLVHPDTYRGIATSGSNAIKQFSPVAKIRVT